MSLIDLSPLQYVLNSFIHFRYLYSAPSRFLLRGAPDYCADTKSEFHAEAHEQLRVKDLPRVPTRRLEVDSNPQPSSCKAPNIPLHPRAPHYCHNATMKCCCWTYSSPSSFLSHVYIYG